jgi:GntR family transcriptional regulator
MNGPTGVGAPIYVMLADRLADEILAGVHPDGTLLPSTNTLANEFSINPATARRALGKLAHDGVLEKQRGIGMKVAVGARQRIRADRRRTFVARHVTPLVDEAAALGIPKADVQRMLAGRSTGTALFDTVSFDDMVAVLATAG